MNTRPTIKSLESDIFQILRCYYDTVMAYQTACLQGGDRERYRLLNSLEEQEKDIKFAIDNYMKLRRWNNKLDCVWFIDGEGIELTFFRRLPNGKRTYKRRMF